jgi:hypothetical protein
MPDSGRHTRISSRSSNRPLYCGGCRHLMPISQSLSTSKRFERIFAKPLPLNDPLSIRKRARLTEDVAPRSVQDVVNAIVASIDFINAEPNKAAEMWSKEIGFPVEVINYSLNEGISIYSRNVV